LCRNVAFTYFAAPVQRDVLARIAAHSRPGAAPSRPFRPRFYPARPHTVRSLLRGTAALLWTARQEGRRATRTAPEPQ
jgi:hypothetical protein